MPKPKFQHGLSNSLFRLNGVSVKYDVDIKSEAFSHIEKHDDADDDFILVRLDMLYIHPTKISKPCI